MGVFFVVFFLLLFFIGTWEVGGTRYFKFFSKAFLPEYGGESKTALPVSIQLIKLRQVMRRC